ncbi:MAG TPA: hypothetical protein V6D47_10680 [Oscillatoriaceae cyanobacterium]
MPRQRKRLFAALIAACMLAPQLPVLAAPQTPAAVLASLKPGTQLDGFKAVALYRDAANKPMGARFVHVKSGFTLDVLDIQSVPQGFIWVNSWPVSDRGEPHTQEHLLLGKGNQGRAVANLDTMALADSNAYTEQRRTCYLFDTAAGSEAFFTLFKAHMNALLHPDYTDEEIRREVCNFGLAQNPDGSLRLEEKGTVYNEMVSTFERPWTRLYRQLNLDLYGPDHPLSYVSGGSPAGLRSLQPTDIRKFHDANYHLANMGVVIAIPKVMALGDTLKRLDQILNQVEPDAGKLKGTFKTAAQLPPPRPTGSGQIDVVGYPDKNAANPGQLLFAWPADLRFKTNQDYLLAELFVSAIAGDTTTNLYKTFIDTKTRKMDVGASGVFGYVDDDEGHPIAIGLTDVASAQLTPARITQVRAQIAQELARIASWPDGSAELTAFNARVRALITEQHRDLSKFVNSPPGFGFRDTNSAWIDQLDRLADFGGFNRSVTMSADLAALDRELTGSKNLWRDKLQAWHLLDTTPDAVAAKPDPELVKQDQRELQARLGDELLALEKRYGVAAKNAQVALQLYQKDYDTASAQIKAQEAGDPPVHFIQNPPLSQDPQLDYHVVKLAHGIPLVASTFDNMTSATVGLALRVDDVPQRDFVYLAMLPSLLTNTGVIDHGKAVSFDTMTERLRNEILSLGANFTRNPHTGRCELVIKGAGDNPAESARAVEWMKRVAFAPDWRVENLPRLRDLVDQTIADLHNTMKGAEENWVQGPADAYAHQDQPLQLMAGSFMTREHYAHRLKWLLRDAGTRADRKAISHFMTALAGAGKQGNRQQLQELTDYLATGKTGKELHAAWFPYIKQFAALPVGAKGNAEEAAKDLGLALADLPDDSIATDWAYLCGEMRDDLLVPPQTALANLDFVRRRVMNANKARMFMIASRAEQQALITRSLPSLIAGLGTRRVPTIHYPATPRVTERLQAREPGAHPLFVGLINPNTQSGVFLNRGPLTSYANTDRESLLRYLAGGLYSGGGADSIFMKTWAAGLAYSNGIGESPASGLVDYYAERCPELPQTLRFVVGELKKSKADPKLVDYAIANAFDGSRAAESYEARGEAMAADLADGETPALVSRFHRALLELRAMPGLSQALYKRMPEVYGEVLPGLDEKAKDVKGAIYFVIGPEKQMSLYEGYLKQTEGDGAKLYRLYPRDFWDTGR